MRGPGVVQSDHQSQVKWVVWTARSNVGRCFAPAKPARTIKVSSLGLCTGWWVTPQGHRGDRRTLRRGQARPSLRKTFAAQALPISGEVRGFLKQIMRIAQPDDELVRLATAV